MARRPLFGLMISVLAFLASCGGSDEEAARDGDGESPKNEAVVQADSLTLRLSREKDRFRIDLEVPRAKYGTGEGTWVVFVPECSLRNAVTIRGASRRPIVRRCRGSYKAIERPNPTLRKLTLGIRVLAAPAQGGAVLGTLELASGLTGLRPITDPSQLPGIALALGRRFVDAIGEASVQSHLFGEVLTALSDARRSDLLLSGLGGDLLTILTGRPPSFYLLSGFVGELLATRCDSQAGVLLASGQSYWMEIETDQPPRTLGLDVTIGYLRTDVLPSELSESETFGARLDLTRLVLRHEYRGKQIAFPEELSASLPALEEGLKGGEVAQEKPSVAQEKPAPRTVIHRVLAGPLAEAKRRGKLLLVDFYGAWCPWCVRMDQVLADPGVRATLDRSFYYHKLDVGRFDRHRDCTRRYGVRSIPHVIVFKPDGLVKAAKGGYQPVDPFKRFLEKAAR